MIPVDQEHMHKPDEGSYGDCQRACIASLLELPREQVPHFLHDNCDYKEFNKRVNGFLAQHNLAEIVMPYVYRRVLKAHVHHMMYGRTERGTYHAVVALNGKIVHDPHPSRAGIFIDAETQVALLVHVSKAP